MNLKELLARAKAKGLSDREIAQITGKDYTTVWRWRKKPNTAFVHDKGIEKLEKALADD
jgi:hypothetical protein